MDEYDAIGFGVEWAKFLGLSLEDLNSEKFRNGYVLGRGVLMVRRLEDGGIDWLIAPEWWPTAHAMELLLSGDCYHTVRQPGGGA